MSRSHADRDSREAIGSETLAGLLAEHKRLAGSIARVRLGPDEAEDAVAEAVEKAVARVGQLRRPQAARAWFLRIVANVCYDRLRARQRRAEFLKAAAAERRAGEGVAPAAAGALLAEDRRAVLTHAARSLSPLLRETVALRYAESLKIREIAEAQGVSAAAVEMRLQRALARMRRTLTEMGLTWEDLS